MPGCGAFSCENHLIHILADTFISLFGQNVFYVSGSDIVGADTFYAVSYTHLAWMEAFLGKWDYSAAALIVQEAGGKVTDFDGEDHFIEGHHIIATNGNLHPFFQKLLAEVPPLNM